MRKHQNTNLLGQVRMKTVSLYPVTVTLIHSLGIIFHVSLSVQCNTFQRWTERVTSYPTVGRTHKSTVTRIAIEMTRQERVCQPVMRPITSMTRGKRRTRAYT